jgi:hypothetical protein
MNSASGGVGAMERYFTESKAIRRLGEAQLSVHPRHLSLSVRVFVLMPSRARIKWRRLKQEVTAEQRQRNQNWPMTRVRSHGNGKRTKPSHPEYQNHRQLEDEFGRARNRPNEMEQIKNLRDGPDIPRGRIIWADHESKR